MTQAQWIGAGMWVCAGMVWLLVLLRAGRRTVVQYVCFLLVVVPVFLIFNEVVHWLEDWIPLFRSEIRDLPVLGPRSTGVAGGLLMVGLIVLCSVKRAATGREERSGPSLDGPPGSRR